MFASLAPCEKARARVAHGRVHGVERVAIPGASARLGGLEHGPFERRGRDDSAVARRVEQSAQADRRDVPRKNAAVVWRGVRTGGLPLRSELNRVEAEPTDEAKELEAS